MRRLVVASAILATLLTMPLALAAPASATAPTDHERATAALQYLLAAQNANGSIDGSLGETADFVIGTAAAGYDPATLHGCSAGTGALDFLATASDGATADAAATGKAVLAVVAAGGDPTEFAGRNLLARLTALHHATTGAFGDGSTFGQSFAILALVAAGKAVPESALTELKALQDPDGSWSYGTAPVAAGLGDTNSTAIALMALTAAGDHSADPNALAYLKTQQLADGGFPYQNSSTFGPPASDPDSDSIVLQALVAAGENPEAAAWSQGSSNVVTILRAGQGADGGYAYPGMAENAFTTSQVPAALLRIPYAMAVHPVAGRALSTAACSSPSPSPSSTANATPTPTPTPMPTASPTPTVRTTPRPTPRPTVRPTIRVETVPTVEPAAAATPSAVSPGPVAIVLPPPTPTGSAYGTPTQGVAGATLAEDSSATRGNDAGSSGGLPTPVLYAIAVLFALVAVAGGGWVFMLRPGRR
jgi:hypothetical protein